MKNSLSVLFIFFAGISNASTACYDMNTETHVAREAVKSLIAIAAVPKVVDYFGGVQNEENGHTVVNVQPRFEFTKDWYKVTIRNSDCRVTNIILFAEGLSRNCSTVVCPPKN